MKSKRGCCISLTLRELLSLIEQIFEYLLVVNTYKTDSMLNIISGMGNTSVNKTGHTHTKTKQNL